ncbi:MAG: TVP38/TMEM64 family protein [Geminicoccaceae bacterium]
MIRLLALFLGLAVLVIIPFMIWGDDLEARFAAFNTVEWLQSYGSWAWLAGFLLLAGDLVLPIPATAAMTALGIVYGPWIGGALSALGSFVAGALGYGLCRMFGLRAARRLLGEKDFIRGQQLFAHYGGWLVVFSRWLPVFPEVIACMAGLTRMPAWFFFTSLLCGSVPFGFIFAALGHAGIEQPFLAIGLSALLPLVLWALVHAYLRRQRIMTH